jgi:hypothetical protein
MFLFFGRLGFYLAGLRMFVFSSMDRMRFRLVSLILVCLYVVSLDVSLILVCLHVGAPSCHMLWVRVISLDVSHDIITL